MITTHPSVIQLENSETNETLQTESFSRYNSDWLRGLRAKKAGNEKVIQEMKNDTTITRQTDE